MLFTVTTEIMLKTATGSFYDWWYLDLSWRGFLTIFGVILTECVQLLGEWHYSSEVRWLFSEIEL